MSKILLLAVLLGSVLVTSSAYAQEEYEYVPPSTTAPQVQNTVSLPNYKRWLKESSQERTVGLRERRVKLLLETYSSSSKSKNGQSIMVIYNIGGDPWLAVYTVVEPKINYPTNYIFEYQAVTWVQVGNFVGNERADDESMFNFLKEKYGLQL